MNKKNKLQGDLIVHRPSGCVGLYLGEIDTDDIILWHDGLARYDRHHAAVFLRNYLEKLSDAYDISAR